MTCLYNYLPVDADRAFASTVEAMINLGDFVETEKDSSYEVLHYRTGMTNPLARIVVNRNRPLPIIPALARFVWMISGSNRLADISFYEPKVVGYTDNGLTVPGSCYGHRLFDSRPGLDQIQGVISRLHLNKDSRQASAVVWSPEDAVRESRDIPCEFGMFFHIRRGELVMHNIMRSNNAFRLLPFNFFEFSMLGEVVAASLGVPFAAYLHTVASMHVYKNEKEWRATEAVGESVGQFTSVEMPPMPPGTAYEQAIMLARFESLLRHVNNGSEFNDLFVEAEMKLNDYWLDLFDVLATYKAARMGLNWTDSLPKNETLGALTILDLTNRLGIPPKGGHAGMAVMESLLSSPGGQTVSNAMFANRD